MHSPTLEELSSMVEDVMHLGRQSCYNCITWNVSYTTKIFPYDNEKINVTTTLVIIFFQVWGIWEMWGELFPIVKKSWEKNAKQKLSLQIFSWNAFLPFISSKSKRFVLLENNYRDCKNSELESCQEAQVWLWRSFGCTFSLCTEYLLFSVSRTSAKLFLLGSSSWIQGLES